MWTGYGRRHDLENPDPFSEYPLFVFIEHYKGTDAAEVFKLRFGCHPYEYGQPDWNSEHNERLMTLLGGLIDCSEEYCDCWDSFGGTSTYFVDECAYIEDMQKLNAFFKRDDVLILSETQVIKW